MEVRDYNAQEYNKLNEIMDADKFVSKQGLKKSFLEEAKLCFSKHKADEDFLIVLLHKHNDVGPNEIMLEDYETLPNGKSALTTRKASFAERNEYHQPCKLKFSNSTLIPLEFTSDSLASKSYRKLQKFNDFLSEINEIIVKFDVSNYFGIGMKNREFANDITRDDILAEVIDTDRVANVVTIEKSEQMTSKIETSWCFEDGDIAARAGYLAWTWCIVLGPGHGEEDRHLGAGDVA